MDLREIRNGITHNQKFYVKKLNKFITIQDVKEENGHMP